MTDRWGKLRDQFKTKNIDLDAEFEKFLNEVGTATYIDLSLSSSSKVKRNPMQCFAIIL